MQQILLFFRPLTHSICVNLSKVVRAGVDQVLRTFLFSMREKRRKDEGKAIG